MSFIHPHRIHYCPQRIHFPTFPGLNVLPVEHSLKRLFSAIPDPATSTAVKMTGKTSRLTSVCLPLHLSLNLLLLSPVLAALDAGSCSFPNGQQAAGYAVCDPTASQSSCCFEGEACLQDGLCYGAIGFMYRGACAGFVSLPSLYLAQRRDEECPD